MIKSTKNSRFRVNRRRLENTHIYLHIFIQSIVLKPQVNIVRGVQSLSLAF